VCELARGVARVRHDSEFHAVAPLIDLGSQCHQVEFARRQSVTLAGVPTWIVSREDLVLSKLVWAKQADSELQRRDVRLLLGDGLDVGYVRAWAARLGVLALLDRVSA